MMKNKIIVIPIILLTLLLCGTGTVFATETATKSSNVSITVVVPQQPEPVKKTPVPQTSAISLYPIEVQEHRENNGRQVVKIYELSSNEKPSDISRDGFERDNWYYHLTDITKTETATADARDHVETVTKNTETKDTTEILGQLAPTMAYTSNDGYVGTLTLDISTLAVETAGTKKSSFTVAATREYPHLSSNDPSLVPKTITENGKTLTLSNVSWKTQTSETIDYDQLTESYTAVASYTTTGSKTTITGYVTTAQYKGKISKILTGKTVYTAYFMGTKIVTPTIDHAESETETPNTLEVSQASEIPDAIISTETPKPTETLIPEPITTAEPTVIAQPTTEIEKSANSLPITIGIFATVALIVGGSCFYQARKKKNTEIEKESNPDEEII